MTRLQVQLVALIDNIPLNIKK